jgi:hypothetical protein
VGAKVVCIDASATRIDGVTELVEGSIYVIAAVRPWLGLHMPQHLNEWGLVLEGVVRTWTFGGDFTEDCPFALRRFRPLVSDSDELGIETVLYRAKGLKSKVPARQKEPTA